MTACRYFDGASSRPWPASATVESGGLRVIGDGVDRIVDARAIRPAPATDRGPARLAFEPAGLCEFDDREAAASLFAQLGFRPSAADRLASRTRHAIMITVAFVAVMASLYRWGIPWAADEFISYAPREWDRALGDHVLRSLDDRHLFKPTRIPQVRRDRLIDRFDRLKLPIDRFPLYRVNLSIVFRGFGAPNALALPGDIIVVTDEIVDLASDDDDALLTVLAHETGHIDHRDAMRHLARTTLSSIIAAWYLGDVSNAAAVVAGGLGTLHYSRAAEHDADLYALAAMKANGVSTHGAAELFRRLEAWRPPREGKAVEGEEAGDAQERDPSAQARDGKPTKGSATREAMRERLRLRPPEYLSTHPATADRVRLFETGQP